MQWEYKLVALGLIVDATEPNERDKHEQILNDLGGDGWEADLNAMMRSLDDKLPKE